jgi:hypothetical protein
MSNGELRSSCREVDDARAEASCCPVGLLAIVGASCQNSAVQPAPKCSPSSGTWLPLTCTSVIVYG